MGSPALGPGVGPLELPLPAHRAGIGGQSELYTAGIRGACVLTHRDPSVATTLLPPLVEEATRGSPALPSTLFPPPTAPWGEETGGGGAVGLHTEPACPSALVKEETERVGGGEGGEQDKPLPLCLPATTKEDGAWRDAFPATNSVAALTEPCRPEKEKCTLPGTAFEPLSSAALSSDISAKG